MPRYIVSAKRHLSEEQYAEAKKHLVDQGAVIKDTYKRDGVAPGFLIEFPQNSVSTLAAGPHIEAVEADGEVTTQ